VAPFGCASEGGFTSVVLLGSVISLEMCSYFSLQARKKTQTPKMSKIAIVVFSCLIASALAVGGVRDWAGNYYDGTTGQISSSLTGNVYNTRPTNWGPAPLYAAAPLVASYAHAPLVASYAAPYAAPYYGSPLVASYNGAYVLRK
jgi:hypothetical protein